MRVGGVVGGGVGAGEVRAARGAAGGEARLGAVTLWKNAVGGVCSPEVPAGEIVGGQDDSAEVVVLVAGGRVKLRGGEAVSRGAEELGSPHFGTGEVRVGEAGEIELGLGEVLSHEVPAGEIVRREAD